MISTWHPHDYIWLLWYPYNITMISSWFFFCIILPVSTTGLDNLEGYWGSLGLGRRLVRTLRKIHEQKAPEEWKELVAGGHWETMGGWTMARLQKCCEMLRLREMKLMRQINSDRGYMGYADRRRSMAHIRTIRTLIPVTLPLETRSEGDGVGLSMAPWTAGPGGKSHQRSAVLQLWAQGSHELRVLGWDKWRVLAIRTCFSDPQRRYSKIFRLTWRPEEICRSREELWSTYLCMSLVSTQHVMMMMMWWWWWWPCGRVANPVPHGVLPPVTHNYHSSIPSCIPAQPSSDFFQGFLGRGAGNQHPADGGRLDPLSGGVWILPAGSLTKMGWEGEPRNVGSMMNHDSRMLQCKHRKTCSCFLISFILWRLNP